MTKRILLVLIIAAVTAIGIFADTGDLQLSAGGGAYFTSDFGGGIEFSETIEGFPVSMSLTTPYAGGGIYGFFDATYVEISAGFFFASGDTGLSMKLAGYKLLDEAVKTDYFGLDLGLMGKYPIGITDRISLFPMAGINYRVMLSAKFDLEEAGDFDAADFSALWFQFGAGSDIALGDALFLRINALYGIRLENKAETDGVNDLKDMMQIMLGINSNPTAILGHGLTIKAAVGVKF
jgi:hypothetical protein